MSADGTAIHPGTPEAPAASVPEQSRRRVPLSPTDRIVRQVEAIDEWVAARRQRELVLHRPGLTRDERMDADRELEVLRRTHDAIKGHCARALDADVAPMSAPGTTVVLAHRHTWFADRLALLLGAHGVTVLACTDNGADALGAVVAGQPDIVLVGERLAMIPGPALLHLARRYARSTLLAAQGDSEQADSLRSAAGIVFLRHHPPAVVAEALVAALGRGGGEAGGRAL